MEFRKQNMLSISCSIISWLFPVSLHIASIYSFLYLEMQQPFILKGQIICFGCFIFVIFDTRVYGKILFYINTIHRVSRKTRIRKQNCSLFMHSTLTNFFGQFIDKIKLPSNTVGQCNLTLLQTTTKILTTVPK